MAGGAGVGDVIPRSPRAQQLSSRIADNRIALGDSDYRDHEEIRRAIFAHVAWRNRNCDAASVKRREKHKMSFTTALGSRVGPLADADGPSCVC